MYYRESFQFMEGRDLQNLKRVPEWARAERMDRTVPLKELWRYSGPSELKKNSIFTGIFSKVRRIGK